MTAVVAGERLKRALSRSGREADVTIVYVVEHTKPWSSCAFVGGRHELVITAADEPHVRAWLDSLYEDSFMVPGYILADLVVSGTEADGGIITATLHAMTVEEA